MRVFHTENAICMIKIPTDTQIILDLHLLRLSSSLDEKRSLMTPMMRNMTAIAMKKFLIWKAIVVNIPITHSPHAAPGVKKNSRTGEVNSSKRVLEFVVVPRFVSRTLVSSGTAEVVLAIKKKERKTRIIRVIIGRNKVICFSISNRCKKCKHSRGIAEKQRALHTVLSVKILFADDPGTPSAEKIYLAHLLCVKSLREFFSFLSLAYDLISKIFFFTDNLGISCF